MIERIPHAWAVPVLLLVFAVAGFAALSRESATFDETTHLPSGITYLERHDFRHNPEHPPLAKMWAALPPELLGRAQADYDSPHWLGKHVPPSDPQRSRASQWVFGFELLNGKRDDPVRRDPGRLLAPARSAILVLGILTALLAYVWSRELWGKGGALLTLALCCLSPTLLAHAGLVTTDLPVALGYLATLWCAYRFLERPSSRLAAAMGLALGAALLTKFSALLLLPILVILATVRVATSPRLAARVAGGVAAAFAIAWIAIWAGYGFRWSAVADPGYRLEWESVKQNPAVAWAKDAHALPEAYLFGIAYTASGAQYRLAFLNGEESVTGRWLYFPEAFLLKTPPAVLALLVWMLADGIARARGVSYRGAFLALPVVVYLALSMTGNLNIGHRHLVPVYPLLHVGIGSLARPLGSSRRRAYALAALVLGSAVSFALATPRYLSYFNVLAGGPSGGWRYLVDSNIDWGQDLPGLRAWMEEHAIPEVHLAYFGTADPAAYGIRYRKVMMVHDFYPDNPSSLPASGDVLAVSVTLLQGVYLDRDRTFAEEAERRGIVPAESVRRWLALREESLTRGAPYPSLPEWMVRQGILTREQRGSVESALLITWMDRVRTTLTPIGKAGDSIYLYRMP